VVHLLHEHVPALVAFRLQLPPVVIEQSVSQQTESSQNPDLH
jgi:hypothetical protein